MRPRLLDVFCGAGGSAKGYQEAGFYVVGVDHLPQPHYCGDDFVQADALDVLDSEWARSFDAIHASPPCQAFTQMSDIADERYYALATAERLVRGLWNGRHIAGSSAPFDEGERTALVNILPDEKEKDG